MVENWADKIKNIISFYFAKQFSNMYTFAFKLFTPVGHFASFKIIRIKNKIKLSIKLAQSRI